MQVEETVENFEYELLEELKYDLSDIKMLEPPSNFLVALFNKIRSLAWG